MKKTASGKRGGKILGIGLPRTGTTSLCDAMTALGYCSYHFPFEMWESMDFTKLSNFDFLCDTPVYAMFEEIEARVGKCKFIHTTRSLDSWLRSMEWLLREGRRIWPWRQAYDRFNEKFFGSAEFDADLYAAAYRRHHQKLDGYFLDRPKDLLVLDLTREPEWDSLCEFLGVNVPVMPFPKSNATRKPGILQQFAVRIDSVSPAMARCVNGLRRRIERT